MALKDDDSIEQEMLTSGKADLVPPQEQGYSHQHKYTGQGERRSGWQKQKEKMEMEVLFWYAI